MKLIRMILVVQFHPGQRRLQVKRLEQETVFSFSWAEDVRVLFDCSGSRRSAL